MCCSTVWCARVNVTCDAYPACDPGDVPVDVCPPGAACYGRSVCGTSITCEHAGVDGGGACNPSVEYWRKYVGTSPNSCAVIDFACAANTTGFSNACGCGCEQSTNCPEYIDCMPGPTPNPQCSDAFKAQCPYSVIAY
jgi:hypothetical protein